MSTAFERAKPHVVPMRFERPERMNRVYRTVLSASINQILFGRQTGYFK